MMANLSSPQQEAGARLRVEVSTLGFDPSLGLELGRMSHPKPSRSGRPMRAAPPPRLLRGHVYRKTRARARRLSKEGTLDRLAHRANASPEGFPERCRPILRRKTVAIAGFRDVNDEAGIEQNVERVASL